ncbi:uncharacterized protein LOC131944995 [Physella acuta]|uniref:uncharacterized protein LOC131944995 n=1 Tax=Physella acuta TaxID=109671 RepID=UPI0027DDCC51|nr:uncharacterized protein LOC131944995 [Physella acuta]XP_059161905.1 uncharacterized protein LOC131944995 [Physella acuta]XP_059161908.1 uncharacterized protein LOC131944995 [Physella acuta]
MTSCVYQLVCAVCVLMSCLPQTSADFSTERGKVNEACSKTLDTCLMLSGSSTPSSDAGWCTLFGGTVNGVSAYQCVVRIGLCTDEEFVALKNGACRQTATVQTQSSYLKTYLYNVVKSTSSACQDQIVDCIFGSSVATVLKQQEQYCKLMNLGITGKTTTTCLSPACSTTELTSLKIISCLTTQSQPFSDAIVATSQVCQNGMESCTYGVTEALALIKGEKYCDVMSLSFATTAHDCLIAAGCTETEFQNLKAAACSNSHIVDFNKERGKVSEACRKTLDTCVILSGSSTPSTDADWCYLLVAPLNSVSAYQCVVRIGLCTDEEFVALKNGACGQTATVQTQSSYLKTYLYNVLKSTNSACQDQIVDCIFGSSVATVLKQQEQYCKLMNLVVTGKTTRDCLAPVCTSSEFINLKTTACSTTQSQPFSDAIVATSQMCQDGMESCTYVVKEALALIKSEKYCDVMSLSGTTTSHDCLIAAGCTETEFQNVKATACSGSNIVEFITQRTMMSTACSKTLDTCVKLSESPTPTSNAGWCTLFGATVNGVSAYQCVVRIGLCTDEEFVALKNAACGQKAAVQQASSALKISMYNVVKLTSDTCKSKIVDCIYGSSIATVLKQQEQYCKLMNLGITGKTIKNCLAGYCSSAEIVNLKTIACLTTQSKPFSDAIVATSQMCQDGMESCTFGVIQALALIKGEKYCDVMSLSVATTAHDCLIAAGCTETEFQKVKAAACSGSNIVDFNTERGKVSEACSKTLETCVTLSGSSAPSNDAGWCFLFGATVNGVSAYQCVVRIGLCTDEEFVALKNGACRQTAKVQQQSSYLKTYLYNVVKSTSSACQDQIVDCIFGSSVATVLKQQEQYCKLMNLVVTGKTTRDCLAPVCTSAEFINLKTTACSTTQSQSFPDAIVATFQMCQDGMESCTYGVKDALALIKVEKYCDVMSLTTVHDCLIKVGCTETEFQKVKTAACSGSNIMASLIMLAIALLLQLFLY